MGLFDIIERSFRKELEKLQDDADRINRIGLEGHITIHYLDDSIKNKLFHSRRPLTYYFVSKELQSEYDKLKANIKYMLEDVVR